MSTPQRRTEEAGRPGGGGSPGADPAGRAPGAGRPLDFLPVNFTVSAEERMRGYAGIPAHALRARRWEDLVEAFWARVEAAWRREAEAGVEGFMDRWRGVVRALDYRRLEAEARDFNQYYPIEASLPMDPRTSDYVHHGERFARVRAPDATEVLRRFAAPPAAT